ncbi:hypothetical protein [Maricaulis sp. CAU 1757]
MSRWYKPVPLTPRARDTVPDESGVYVLLENEADLTSVLKIGPTRSLRRMFEREAEGPAAERPAKPTAMMFWPTSSDAREASRLIVEYRRKRGRSPALNAAF